MLWYWYRQVPGRQYYQGKLPAESREAACCFSRTSAAAFEPDPPVFYFKNGTAGVAARFSLFKMALPAWLPLNLFGFRHSYCVLD